MPDYKARATQKRERLSNCIPDHWRVPSSQLPSDDILDVSDFPSTSGLLTPAELEITETNLVTLAQKIASGQWSAKEVTLAFCHRAAIAHQLTNCCAEIFFDVAIATAESLDANFKRNGKVLGPLHGVPVSLKDQFRITGIETSMGYVAWLDRYENHDSVLTKLLRNAGAVLYVKTNVPQTLMLGETINNISGRTLNPYNRRLSPGGSSGGEGALVGMRGSVIGVGTDIGGSIRIPSAFCNLYGLKPSHGRLPYALTNNSMAGQETVHSVCGPLAHSPEDIAYFTRAVLLQEPWYADPKVIPSPWNPDKMAAGTSGVKTFGLIDFDGEVMPHPPIQRALKEVVTGLKAHGHNVVVFPPYDHERGIALVNRVYDADGYKDFRDVLAEGGEPAIPNNARLNNTDAKALTINESWDLQIERYEYQREYMEHWNRQNHEHGKIDAIIMPVSPHAAVTHDDSMYYGYTSITNLLDYSAVVVPVGFADPALDPINSNYQPISDLDAQVWKNYDPIKYAKGPTAVQLVGRRFEEEYMIGLAQQVKDCLIKRDTLN